MDLKAYLNLEAMVSPQLKLVETINNLGEGILVSPSLRQTDYTRGVFT